MTTASRILIASLALTLACGRGSSSTSSAEAGDAKVDEKAEPSEPGEPTSPAARDCSDEEVLGLIGGEVVTLEDLAPSSEPESANEQYARAARASRVDTLIRLRLVDLEAERLGLDEAKIDALFAGFPPTFRRMHGRRKPTMGGEKWEAEHRRYRLLIAILAETGRLEVGDDEAREYWEREVEPAFETQPLPGDRHALDEDRVHLRGIVVKIGSDRPNRSTADEARVDAERIAALIRSGEVDFFDELARRESDEVMRKPHSYPGEYGFAIRSDLNRKLARSIFAAAAGEVLVLEIEGGFEVFEIVGHWGPGPLPYEAYREGVRSAVINKKLVEWEEPVREELRKRYAPINCEKQRREEARARRKAERAQRRK